MESARYKAANWMKFILIAAGIYNLVWGLIAIIEPGLYFNFSKMPLPNYPELWQCIGMIVGVYGIGYIIASFDPYKHWPIILVGLLGKILGPVGFINAYIKGTFTLNAGLINITNDIVWWVPFTIILIKVYRYYHTK